MEVHSTLFAVASAVQSRVYYATLTIMILSSTIHGPRQSRLDGCSAGGADTQRPLYGVAFVFMGVSFRSVWFRCHHPLPGAASDGPQVLVKLYPQ
jgi:hypothetical protein